MHGLYSLKASVLAGSSLFTLPIIRGFTRLSTVYVTFSDGANKWIKQFFCLMADEANTTVTDRMEYNITIGSDRWPAFNCERIQGTAYRLRVATSAHWGNDIFSITGEAYRDDKFIIRQSFEKAPGQSSYTGVNIRSGSQLSMNFKNFGATTMDHVVMHYEQVLNLSAAGAEIRD